MNLKKKKESQIHTVPSGPLPLPGSTVSRRASFEGMNELLLDAY